MAKRRRRPKTEKSGWGTRDVLLAAALFLLFAFFIRDATGVRHGLLGSYLWATAFIITFLIALQRNARYLLPAEVPNSRQEAFLLLLRYTFRIMLPERLRRMLGIRGFAAAPRELSEGFARLGIGFVDSHIALVLVEGTQHRRAAGPGYVKLNPGESIRHVIDLRPHVRTLPVPATTRDGLSVETTITVVFQVRQNRQEWGLSSPEGIPAEHDIIYPYAQEAIFRISYAIGITEDDDEVFWTERIAPVAAALLVTVLSRRTLNELYEYNDAAAMPLDIISREVQLLLDDQLTQIFGRLHTGEGAVQLLAVSVGQIFPPLAVLKQRIANWQAEWERRIYLEKIRGNAQAMLRSREARAKAQLELIEQIMNNIETLNHTQDLSLTDIVTLRVLETIEQLNQNNEAQAEIPNRVLLTISQIRGFLREP
ncbi:MAG: hypothetical protein KA338_14775 [Chloroflexi bacterium]|nr:hypothetical protein [Chloroflexota bacterium]